MDNLCEDSYTTPKTLDPISSLSRGFAKSQALCLAVHLYAYMTSMRQYIFFNPSYV